ncbi:MULTISPECIES: hypothetical protein [Isoptericola]|uniref:Uncharacterized protein n=1 Tax=Isoptericola sediminis TaxID=2733572 RepID=A0A849JRN7_9MICO|nr:MULTISPECIES: hypothetical protein [Isoptericola]MDO8145562.1 hypothetical protein [Isoptericola sp. 178]MDO8149242.1 hypothetical protein [Isoptericola sp. b515]MDO8152181.1 hypothetical protein [Isoptericola sp. b408]NNU26106.1 hypothetical protein [Isoptericola sediminis]
MTVTSRAVTTAVLATLVATAAYLGPWWTLGACGLLILLLTAGWAPLLRLPAEGATSVVVLLAGAGGLAVTWFTEGEPILRNLPLVIALSLVLAFVAQMLRRGGRPRLVESVSGMTAGVVVTVSAAGWLATASTDAGAGLVVTSAVGLAVASAVAALPVAGGWIGSLLGVVLGGAAGAGTASALPEVEPVHGLVVGLVAGLVSAALRLLFERQPALERRRAAAAAAAVPVTITGMLVFVVGRMLL